MTTTYASRDEAIRTEITGPIEISGLIRLTDEQAREIADRVLGDYEQGYAMLLDEPEFWAVVEEVVEG